MSENRKRKLDKSTLAQTFRFDCDRFLRFRLATAEERDRINLGNERYSRPGIAQIRGAGRRWEADQYEDLITAFGEGDSRVRFERATEEDENARRRMFLPVTNLRTLLRQDSPPEVLLEAEYDLLPDAVPGLAQAYGEFNLDPVKMRPDILWIRPARSGAPLIGNPVPDSVEYEIHVIDVKMVKEPNLRHFTEVTYYALALAQIITAWGLQSRYAVSAQGYIWPGSYVQHRFRDLLAQHQTESSPLTATLLEILVPIPYEVYQVHVREFFQSRLLPVLRTDVVGTAWHVQPSCALCDYLKFCREQAQRDDHLSRVAWLSRGQAEALRQNGISTTAQLATAILDRTTNWQDATVTNQQLRANEPALAARAEALASQTVVLAEGRKAASMPKWTDMNIFLSIHSDPGSGLVFALGVSHVYWHPGRAQGEAPRKDRDPHVFVVTSAGDFRNDRVMRSENERQRLSEFLDLIMSWLQEVDLSLIMRTRGSATSRKHNRHEHYEKQVRQEI